ncbi:hypothetical protein MA6G0728R_0704 [Mycobacteroides abscessus 6G-0728-R]|uniref:Uncharacterized protein n=1 Tax=Mycobacteroides abscessus 1948 TaxID=1299323 RepID=A0A829QN31_9MYCO|nr:hypothetical protein MA6G0125R_4973 [Mycobacteroides abscessus 6G-0125-R]EIU50474.1 hypothetical protein MA6G0125S_0711 [Mycobacteroides abscessus 6G-0125-S]EIU56024.1 hypothetical protein MA6G0728S_1042 [Mycobacteroides abscessus 6G-0728-S]EIU66906.1 hypothetical protein MA6G1108_0699 [Mycobacteroides abscessus 6G-1108]EIU99485.1 hypothetical protein MA6G0212_0770 [Mycobacteroides abscessus 6G-0212]EIV02708.1 hypothetical protein MA6G0728R_0704 [Mycobacteroides abscessus 6G-0728-R]EIV2150
MKTLARYRDLGATSTMGRHVSLGGSDRVRQIFIFCPRSSRHVGLSA